MAGRRPRTRRVLPDPCERPGHPGCRWCGSPSPADVAADRAYRSLAAQRKAINDAAAAAERNGTFPYPLGTLIRSVSW